MFVLGYREVSGNVLCDLLELEKKLDIIIYCAFVRSAGESA